MAEAVQEKSRGLKFAEQQLLRHGWEQGKGLGREENGISEAIKVSVKCDKGGVGHRQGEQFSFHWWDHVFNKASSSLEVESDQNGVQVKKLVEEEEAGMISNKKPRKASLAKDKLYGCFVKSATLLSGQELPEQKTSSSDSSSSDDEDQRLDLSSTTQLSDADLMKACGGRTAHKGARHGLTMSAKLARLEQQEQEFMAKYGKTSQSAASPESAVVVEQSAQTPEVEAAVADETRSKKSKKKKKRKNDDAEEKAPEESAEAAVSESPEPDVTPKKKKKKKKKRSSVEGGEAETEAAMLEEQPAAGVTEDLHARKKQRKSRRTMEEDSGRLNGTACETADTLQGETAGETAGEREEASDHDAGEGLAQPQTHTDPNIKHRKKKKKASKSERENTALDETENKDPGTAEDGVPNEKRGDGAGEVERGEEHDMVEEEEEREEPKMKRKKKRCKEDRQSAEHREQDGPATPKKKRKKTKERQKELD